MDVETGGAREGDRYSCSRYTLRVPEGYTSRGARETRGSPGDAEGYTTRARGVRHVTSKDQLRTKEGGGAPLREPWLKAARSVWAESVGAPPSWFDTDLRPLVTPSRTSEAVLAALRAYVQGVAPDKAGTGDFARRIGAWMRREAKAPEVEVYTGSDEQRRAKAARYGVTI